MSCISMPRLFLLLISSIVFAACSGDGTGPTTGTLAIDVTTTGVDIDANGFFLSVDGKPIQSLSPNGSIDWVGSGGSHTLSITGLAFNCTLTAPPAAATVTPGQTTHVAFNATCGPFLSNAIIYTSEGSGIPEVMVMRSDGSRSQRLTTDQVSYATPSVSPDGQTIAVASRAGGFWSVYLLDRFGQSPRKLIPGRLSSDGSPLWSPDGSKIAFRGTLGGPNGDYGRIFVVNRDGTGLRQVTPETPEYSTDNGLTWSPDGAQIVYDHNSVLWVVNADGSGAQSLGIGGMDPALSPNGQRITYSAWLNNMLTIFIADLNGANAHPLTTPVQQDGYARWSPNGQEIVFERVASGVTHLYKIAPDGTGLTPLGSASGNDAQGSFSPVP